MTRPVHIILPGEPEKAKTHKCEKPSLSAYSPGTLWMCSECQKWWYRTVLDIYGNRLEVWNRVRWYHIRMQNRIYDYAHRSTITFDH